MPPQPDALSARSDLSGLSGKPGSLVEIKTDCPTINLRRHAVITAWQADNKDLTLVLRERFSLWMWACWSSLDNQNHSLTNFFPANTWVRAYGTWKYLVHSYTFNYYFFSTFNFPLAEFMCGRILEKICLQGLGNSGDKSRPRHQHHCGDPFEGTKGTLAHPAIPKYSNLPELSEKNLKD